ncbi:STAS/SEC14 domain-containing protein [Photobacterium halotolerans]|uniref:STAS/SEC14 domain-containing protein n=1 Tax=Photobacterium halotolerans TaxID=265726 RepID=UPI0004048E06|nr:STAS/SEC14 domain-containing protein [Photobacterium halotolerans]NAW84942.1 STAS/SEC14 domain-containing protein [Photobacterium halotolerans]NAX47971.1 STAS/SEC14 domain-containing protein [Photobacterium halotolerans]
MHTTHGLLFEVDRDGDNFFMELKAIGKLTHQDYERITPLIDDALDGVANPKVNVYFDGSEFEGWELQAAWDDLKLGLKHGKKFHRIAIYGNQRWMDIVAKIGSWFISGEVKCFDTPFDALAWLRED